MGTPETATKKFGIWEKLELLKKGAKIGKQMHIGDFEEVMDMTKEIILPFVKQLDKPIFSSNQRNENVPEGYLKKRGLLMFESKIINIWLQRSGEWFTRYRYPDSSNFSFDDGVGSWGIADAILAESDRFLGNSFVERAKNCLEVLPFLKQVYMYYILPLNFVTQSFVTVKKMVEERRQQLLEMEKTLGFLGEFTQSLDPLTCRRKKVSLTGYSIFVDGEKGEYRRTADYFTPKNLNPFWKIVNKMDTKDKYHQKDSKRQFDSLDSLIKHLMFVCGEITTTPPKNNNSVETLFGLSSVRLPLSENEIAVIKKLIESI